MGRLTREPDAPAPRAGLAPKLARWLLCTAGFWLVGNLLWMAMYLVVGGWPGWAGLARFLGTVSAFAAANALLAMPPMAGWIWLCRRKPALDLKPLVRRTYALAVGFASSYAWLASGQIHQFDLRFWGFVSMGLIYVAWAAIAFEVPRKLVRALRPGTFAPGSELEALPRWFAWRVAGVYLVLWAATVPSAHAIHQYERPPATVVAVVPGLLLAEGMAHASSGHPDSRRDWYAGIAGFHRMILHDDDFTP